MCIKNNSSGQCFFIFWTTYNYIVLFVMHQSVTAVPLPTPPPRLPRGICLPYQSRGWALANFACPGGWAFANPRAPKCLTRMQYPNITKRNMEDFTEIQADQRLADWFTCQGQENLAEIFEGIFSQFYVCVSPLFIKLELQSEIGSY